MAPRSRNETAKKKMSPKKTGTSGPGFVRKRGPKGRLQAQPLIAVRNVEASSRWYQRLLECQSGHGGPEYERLLKNGQVLLQLHHWNDHEHVNLGDPHAAPHGYGVLLWFETDAFDAAVERARSLGAEIVEDVHVNPSARHRELWIRDLDGYVVVIASPGGEAG
jgi:catechol 2,3-dioxygenase-like lactoylglutathione lyase family enzyme